METEILSDSVPKHSARAGLSDQEVARLRAEHGWNELPKPRKVSPVTVFLRQFTSFLVVILIVAAGIAFFLGERIDTLAILLVVLLNGGLGFVQEWRAETALDALRRMLSPQALVIRNGRETVLPARELVPGDLILLEAGDRIPADGQLMTAIQLSVDESVLTGESMPVEKGIGVPAMTAEAGLVFTGTSVVAGRGEARVSSIGTATSFGKIADLTGSVERRQTSLQRQLGVLARQLGIAALAIAAVILAMGVGLGREPMEMFMTGLSLAVAMVPEGLPAVVTITLALGASAMVRQKALARRLQAVETLGAASVICTDKTGTLTENRMTATRVWMSDAIYDVTGTGHDPAGHIASNGTRIRGADDPGLGRLLETAITCSHARLRHEEGHWVAIGEPTETALVTLAYKGWAQIPDPDDLVAEVPFSSDRKCMSVVARTGGAEAMFTKGAPAQVLERCSRIHAGGTARLLEDADRERIQEAYRAMAADGLRVLAFAWRPVVSEDHEEGELIFLGLAGLIDPPRPEVRAAVAQAQAAGIRIIMITGDSHVTAKAIAEGLGIELDRTLTGKELEAMEDAELEAALRGPVLFARTRPADKMRIIAALQRDNQIVAMTGDGVNDAPALKQADIGVSMGVRGTDVAKDASDLVLLDDNFATIVRAIGEGRRQFENVRKFVRYLLSSNAGEVIAIMANILLGGPLIFLATQILWMNLITDGITAVALGLEKSEPGNMKKPPRRKNEPILGINGLSLILLFGLYTGFSSLWIFTQLLPGGEAQARTAAFTAMVLFEKFSVFAFRSLREPCWRIGYLSNPLLLGALTLTILAQVAAVYWPPLQVLLHTVGLGPDVWILILTFALPILIVPELIKTGVFAARRMGAGRVVA